MPTATRSLAGQLAGYRWLLHVSLAVLFVCIPEPAKSEDSEVVLKKLQLLEARFESLFDHPTQSLLGRLDPRRFQEVYQARRELQASINRLQASIKAGEEQSSEQLDSRLTRAVRLVSKSTQQLRAVHYAARATGGPHQLPRRDLMVELGLRQDLRDRLRVRQAKIHYGPKLVLDESNEPEDR